MNCGEDEAAIQGRIAMRMSRKAIKRRPCGRAPIIALWYLQEVYDR